MIELPALELLAGKFESERTTEQVRTIATLSLQLERMIVNPSLQLERMIVNPSLQLEQMIELERKTEQGHLELRSVSQIVRRLS